MQHSVRRQQVGGGTRRLTLYQIGTGRRAQGGPCPRPVELDPPFLPPRPQTGGTPCIPRVPPPPVWYILVLIPSDSDRRGFLVPTMPAIVRCRSRVGRPIVRIALSASRPELLVPVRPGLSPHPSCLVRCRRADYPSWLL